MATAIGPFGPAPDGQPRSSWTVPVFVAAACPLAMILMMRNMGHGGRGGHGRGEGEERGASATEAEAPRS